MASAATTWSSFPLSVLAAALLVALAAAGPRPQYYPVEPNWDIDKIILSRNGPSKPTTQRPTAWTTTTLREFGISSLPPGRTGLSEVDELTVRNRPREAPRSASPVRGAAGKTPQAPVAVVVAALLASVWYLRPV